MVITLDLGLLMGDQVISYPACFINVSTRLLLRKRSSGFSNRQTTESVEELNGVGALRDHIV